MSAPERISSIVIVGGGSAGWMTAAALSRFLPTHVAITLVESDAIGTVGVGEATIPNIATFNAMLGIDEDEFLSATGGTFKLGIEFRDWGRLGERYMHPFGQFGYDLAGTDFHHFWMRQRAEGVPHELAEYSLNTKAAYADKFARSDGDPRSPLAPMRHAYHFDASLYAAFLRRHAEGRGVSRIEGRVVDVEKKGESGHVQSVLLESGQKLSGELFVDCSGFRGVLIEQSLESGFESWRKWLPMDRAVAMPCEAVEPPRPYTISAAQRAGWIWHIPLQHRVGNGHVYCSEHCNSDEALAALEQALPGEPLAGPNHLHFEAGCRHEYWKGNCVAIGLSAGFIEPLESTSIHLIQTGIAKLLALFPDRSFHAPDRDEFNRLLRVSFEHIRDFIIMHYIASARDDSPFWQQMRQTEPPQSLSEKIALLEGYGRFSRNDEELFTLPNWLAVLHGQGRGPRFYSPMADAIPQANVTQGLDNMRAHIAKTVRAMPSHQDFLERFCKAAPARSAGTVQ